MLRSIAWARARLERPAAQVLVFLAVLTAAKLGLSARLDVNPDEAYHWLLSQHLAWGYLEHPPMIAGVVRLSTWLAGDGPFGVRFLTVLCGAGSVWLTFLMARRLYDERAARLAAMVVGVVPGLFAYGAQALPDAPLLLFWTATLWTLAHVFSGDRPAWWYAAGIFLGLAMLSKYHAVFLAFGVLLFLLASPAHRGWLARPQPYLAALLALLVFSPHLVWNAGHDFDTLLYQGLTRFQHGSSLRWDTVLNFPVVELDQLTPVIALWAWGIGFARLAHWRRASWQDRLMVAAGLPVMLFFAFLSVERRVHGHWTLPGYPSILALSAAAVISGGRWGRGLHIASLAALCAMYLIVAVALEWLVDPGRLGAWERVSVEVNRTGPDFILAPNYHDAAEVAYHLRPLPVCDFTALGTPDKSFRYWWNGDGLAGRNAVIVIDQEGAGQYADLLPRFFERLAEPVMMAYRPLREKEQKIVLIRGEGFRPDGSARH